jgi:hypothetical protein
MIDEDVPMKISPLRLLTAFAVMLALALPAAGLAAPGRATIDRGVVQSANAGQIVLRTLDGVSLSFQVTPFTRVRVNGRPAAITDVGPGFVAEVAADRKGRAVLVRAFGTSAAAATINDRGVVTAISSTAITLATDAGPRTIALDRSTQFRVAGIPAGPHAVRPGAIVVVTHGPDAPAVVVNVLKRTGA